MTDTIRFIASESTPMPGVGIQVANDLKDTVNVTAETAGDLVNKLPFIFSRTLVALAVIVIGVLIMKIGKRLITRVALRKGRKNIVAVHRTETSRSIVGSIFSYIVFFIVIAIVLTLFGMDVSSMLAAAGVVSIAVAFGAQTLVKDLLAGLFIWSEKSIAVGDIVSINGMDGTVENITIRTTAIRNYNGNVITIPNGDIRAITNMSRGFKRAIVNVPCPYEESQERLVSIVKEEMETAAHEITGLNEIPNVMSIVAFDHNSVRLQVSVACPVGEHWRIEREIRTRIKARFDREGIIMPHYSVPEAE